MKERQSNIELLRIFAIMGVIILHYNNTSMGGALRFTEGLKVNHTILVILESVAICAVDLFVLISGYFLIGTNRRNMLKPIQLVIQVMVFSELQYLIKALVYRQVISARGIVYAIVPANYFVILYVVLYIISPIYNIAIGKLTGQSLKKLVAICFLLFSLWPTLSDVFNTITKYEWLGLSTIGMYGSQYGYTIVNFSLMYLIGAFLKLSEGEINISRVMLVFVAVCSVIATALWSRIDTTTAWEYCQPFVVILSVAVFLLFKQIDIGHRKWINSLAESGFTCFLLHSVFLPFIRIEQFVTGSVWVMLLHIVAATIGIYCLCWVVYKIYSFVTGLVFDRVNKDRFMLMFETKQE